MSHFCSNTTSQVLKSSKVITFLLLFFQKSNDDSLTQTMLGIYHNMMESLGAIMAHNHVFGTGFRVGSKYIMTAKHVITDILG